MAQAATEGHTFDVNLGSTFLSPSSGDSLYSFRFSQKPASLDAVASGTVSGNPNVPNALFASFPAVHSGSAPQGSNEHEHWFSGSVVAAKEVDCVLIWDDTTGSYKLERLDSSVRLNHERASRGGQSRVHVSLPASPRIPHADDHHSNGSKPAHQTRPIPVSKSAAEVEDFGDFNLVSSMSATAASPPKPLPPAISASPNASPRIGAPSSLSSNPPSPALGSTRSVQPPSKPPTANAKQAPPSRTVEVSPPSQSARGRGAAASKRPPQHPVAASKAPAKPPAAASKRPPAAASPPAAKPPTRAAAAASKRPPPPASAALPSQRPRRSSVAMKSMPAVPPPQPPSSGSDESEDEDSSGSEEEDDDDSGPEGYLAVPGSVLSRAAGGRSSAAVAQGGSSTRATTTTGDEDDDDSEESEMEMEELENSINAGLSAYRGGRRNSTVGSSGAVASKGLPSGRPVAASKMPARPRVASKGPAQHPRVGSKGPAASSGGGRMGSKMPGGGRVASKGPVKSSPPHGGRGQGAMSLNRIMGGDVDARRAADVPDSEEESD
ncbi:hypothetical protein T439DRAFT_328598 [Meredithblackwellia eburnea MCA 4105]